jgi:membrane protein implicated in regulation of membrane protease activity
MSTLTRYVLFQIPGWVVAAAVCAVLWSAGVISAWTAAALLAFWVAKDAAMYPFVREAYRPAPTGAARLVGHDGVTREPLEPTGYVEVGGTLWQAEVAPGTPRVAAGQRVTVCGASGLTLLVAAEPAETDREAASSSPVAPSHPPASSR